MTYTVGAGTPVLVTGFPTTDGAHQFTIDLTGQSGQTVQLDFVNGGTRWWAVNEIQFFAAPPAPEMNVTGNGQDIADGSATPSAGNHTDFGGALVAGGQVTRTFTIENIGKLALSLTGTPIVVISGAQSNDFAVALEPADSVAAGASTTFQVTFDPSATGIADRDGEHRQRRCGRESLRLRDPRRRHLPGPEMNVKGNGQDIADGETTPGVADHTDFGTAFLIGVQVTRTFTIENTGTEALSLTGTPIVVISGAEASDFTVTLEPADSVAAGASTTFQVTFDPSAAGVRTATVSIANDDADEDPYDFAIQGFGTSLITPTTYVYVTPYPNIVGGTRPWARRICSTTGSSRRRTTSPPAPPAATGGPLTT